MTDQQAQQLQVDLANAVRRSNSLLQNPQPGLFTWQSMLIDVMDEITEIWGKIRGAK